MRSETRCDRFLRLVAALAMLAVTAHGLSAQTREARPDPVLYDSSRPDRFLDIKPVAGVGFSTVNTNYASAIPGITDLMMSPGCLVRAGVDVEFVLRRSFAIGTGLSFDYNNLRYAMSIVEIGTGTINSIYSDSRYTCLTIPVYLQWRLNLARRMRWNIEAGVYMSAGIGGRTRSSGYTSGLNSLGQPVINHVTHEGDYYNDDQPLVNGVRSRDWGPRLATGLTYRQRYSLTLVAQYGLPDLAVNHGPLDISYHNMSMTFEFGYTF